MWIKISLEGVGLVGFDFVYKYGFVEYWKIREISTVFTNDLALHRHTTSYNQHILKHSCYMNIDIPSRCWFGWIWLCVQVWLRRILKNTRNIDISIWKCRFYRIHCRFWYKQDFHTWANIKYRRSVMFVWLLLSKPIFWNPETHFRGRIFELEKWVFESTRFDFSSIDLFYDATRQICHGHNWKYVFCGVSIQFSGRVCDFWFWDWREEGGMVNISEVLHRMYPKSKTICVSRVSYSC